MANTDIKFDPNLLNNDKYGILLNDDAKLYRTWFIEAAELQGIKLIYRTPLKEQVFDKYGEVDSPYSNPIITYGFFEDHPDQKTMKKMGWVAELQENSSFVHVRYDLPGLQIGSQFIVPSGLDNVPGRVFRVISMKAGMIYPASISCELALEYKDTSEKTEIYDFSQDTFTKLIDKEDDD